MVGAFFRLVGRVLVMVRLLMIAVTRVLIRACSGLVLARDCEHAAPVTVNNPTAPRKLAVDILS